MKKRNILFLATAATTAGCGFVCACYVEKNPCISKFGEYREYLNSLLPAHPNSDHWLLLRLCHSRSNERSRLLGLRAVANIGNLPNWKAIEIAQACDPSILAALLLRGVPLAKYLPCRVLLESDDTLENKLHSILSQLNSSTTDLCLKFYSEIALRQPSTVHTAQELVPDQCKRFVDQRGLDILARLWRYSEQTKLKLQLQISVLKILANLALHTDLKWYIVQTGWMQIFQERISDRRLEYNLLIKKILHNLSSTLNKDPKFEEGVYVVHGGRDENTKVSKMNSLERPLVDVVFVHGLRGGLFWTWRQRDVVQYPESVQSLIESRPRTSCWPMDWLHYDVNKSIRIIGVDYASFLTAWNPNCSEATTKNSLELRSVELLGKLRKAGIGDRPVIWVAHSMGGLVVKQMLQCLEKGKFLTENELSTCRPMLDNTAGCVFYSVPHYGSPVASMSVDSNYRYLLLPSAEVTDLKENSPYLINLHSDFLRLVNRHRIEVLNLAETLKTKVKVGKRFELLLVPEKSALGGGMGRCYFLRDSHFNMCKPADRNSPNYSILVDFINEILLTLEMYTF